MLFSHSTCSLPTGAAGQESIILIPLTRYGCSPPSCSGPITFSDCCLRQIRDVSWIKDTVNICCESATDYLILNWISEWVLAKWSQSVCSQTMSEWAIRQMTHQVVVKYGDSRNKRVDYGRVFFFSCMICLYFLPDFLYGILTIGSKCE